MAISSYPTSSTIKCKVTLKNSAGTDTDPAGALSLTILEPDGTSTSYTFAAGQLTKTAVGIYFRNVLMDEAGDWHYTFDADMDGDGTVDTSNWKQIRLEPRAA